LTFTLKILYLERSKPTTARIIDMKHTFQYAFAFLAALSVAAPAFADKTYQVTGPVVELTDSTITVAKGKEKWELARDAQTQIKGDLQKGSKVTVEYTMSAAKVEVKSEKPK
jgi:cytochrome c1